jgi:hypothetical protein
VYGGLPVILFVLVGIFIQSRRKRRSAIGFATSWRARVWLLLVVSSAVGSLLAVAAGQGWDGWLWAIGFATPGVLLVTAAPLLRAAARLGRPKLVYVLAQAWMVFPRSGETQAGATLWAALAIAHRGGATAEERAWLRSRLSRETRPLGAFGCACALLRLLDARAARDEGRAGDAEDATTHARALLGTVTYAAPNAVHSTVRRLTHELLALLHASRGQWPGIATMPDLDVPASVVALRAYVHERLREASTSPRTMRALRRARSPALDALFARKPPTPTIPTAEALARGRATFVAMSRHEPVGINAQMSMLWAFDVLMTPEFPDTAIPVEAREDAELVAAMQDDVANAMVPLLAPNPPPIGALRRFGPVSARVYQKLESLLLNELSRMASGVRERAKETWRYDAAREWTDASMSRIAFRRIEQTFGTAAAAQVWPEYGHVYCKLGVLFAETRPRRRPLAHAVFESLRQDAQRFGDEAHAAQNTRNTLVTSGVE